MNRLRAAFGLFILAAGVASADTPPDSPAPAELLVARLGSGRFADREAAAAALEAGGPGVVPALEAAARGPDPETARRAVLILNKLRRAADSHDRLAARAVRLGYKGVPLGTAVDALKARSGINLRLDPAGVADPLRLVTCETGDLPAWEAVGAFCRAAGLREVFAAELDVPKTEARRSRGYYTPPPPAPPADAVPVTLADGPYVALPGTRATAVRVLALPGTFPGHRVILGTGELVLCLDVTPAPGVYWQEVNAVRVTRVVDEADRDGTGGVPYDPPAAGDPFDGPVIVNRRIAMRIMYDGPVAPVTYTNPRVVPVPLHLGTPGARALKLLEGAVLCEVAVPGQALVTVEAPGRHVGVPVAGLAGAKMTVREVQPAPDGAGTVVRVQVDTPSPWLAQRRANPWGPLWPEQTRPAGLGAEVKAYDAGGKPLVPAAVSGNQFSEDGVTLTSVSAMTFTGPAPARLVYTGPRPVVVEVPFRMENVPLP